MKIGTSTERPSAAAGGQGLLTVPPPSTLRAAEPARTRPARAARAGMRLDTRRRLLLAFLAVIAAFLAAFAVALTGLARMERGFAEIDANEESMRLALELEAAIRSQFAHQAHFVVGEDAHLAGYRDARARAAAVLEALSARVQEPQAIGWVRAIGADAGELDRVFQEEIAPAVLRRSPGVMLTHDRTYRLVFQIEENVDRLFAFLRSRCEELSGVVDGVRHTTLRLALLFAAGAGLFAVGIAFGVARSVARPLAALGAGAARMGEGDLSTQIEVRGPPEFRTLAAELNDMAASLRQHQERLVRSEKLAGLGRVAAGVAHELNNPLQVMLGYLTFHRDRAPGELRTVLGRIERETIRCKEIVEALLQLSRPASAFVPVPVDLRDVCDEVADALRVADGARAPRISVEGAGAAMGTPCRLRQILLNLARNAADAAGPGGTVNIRLARVGRDVEVAVADSGPGIPPELRDRVFEPFFTTKASGTGLGLAIARSIANALGGDLELAERSARSAGACFVLRVPAVEGGA